MSRAAHQVKLDGIQKDASGSVHKVYVLIFSKGGEKKYACEMDRDSSDLGWVSTYLN